MDWQGGIELPKKLSLYRKLKPTFCYGGKQIPQNTQEFQLNELHSGICQSKYILNMMPRFAEAGNFSHSSEVEEFDSTDFYCVLYFFIFRL